MFNGVSLRTIIPYTTTAASAALPALQVTLLSPHMEYLSFCHLAADTGEPVPPPADLATVFCHLGSLLNPLLLPNSQLALSNICTPTTDRQFMEHPIMICIMVLRNNILFQYIQATWRNDNHP